MAPSRLVNSLVLAALLVATWMNWSWPWGALFIYWAVPAIHFGEAHLIGPVPRDEQPVLFWAVTALWVLFGILFILTDAAPETFGAWMGQP